MFTKGKIASASNKFIQLYDSDTSVSQTAIKEFYTHEDYSNPRPPSTCPIHITGDENTDTRAMTFARGTQVKQRVRMRDGLCIWLLSAASALASSQLIPKES